MNPFASRNTKTLDVPFDPGQQVTIRKLSGRHLEKAQTEFFNQLVAGVRARGGANVQKDIEQLFQKDPKQTAEAVEKAKADPLNGYDKHVICAKGIVAWTYEESLKPVPPFDMKAVLDLAAKGAVEKAIETVMANVQDAWTIPAIEDLEGEALDFFATEIMRLTKPSLFQTKDEAEADRKND